MMSSFPRSPSTASNHKLCVYDMNTQAVKSLWSGDADGALLVLRHSLHRAKAVLQQEEPSQGATLVGSSNSNSSAVVVLESVPIGPLSAQDTTRAANGDQGAVFDRAFVIHGMTEDMLGRDERYQSLTSAVLLYNMALCHHLRGLHYGLSHEVKRALQLYRMSMTMLEHCIMERPQQTEQRMQAGDAEFRCYNVLALVLAVVNNQAAVHEHLAQGDETRQCLTWLQELVEDYHYDNEDMDDDPLRLSFGDMSEDDHSIFCVNVLTSRPEQRLSSAPAA